MLGGYRFPHLVSSRTAAASSTPTRHCTTTATVRLVPCLGPKGKLTAVDHSSMRASDQWLGHDKLLHFVACFSIVLLSGALLACNAQPPCSTALPARLLARLLGDLRCRRRRLCLALASGAVAGAAKEAGDAADIWPWCGRPGCSASWRDGAADAAGLLAAAAVTCLWWRLRPPSEERVGAEDNRVAAELVPPSSCGAAAVAVLPGDRSSEV